MRSILIILITCLISLSGRAHDIRHDALPLKRWSIQGENRTVQGSFTLCKDGQVYLLDEHRHTLTVPFTSLTDEDQAFVKRKMEWIEQVNQEQPVSGIDGIKAQHDINFVMLGIVLVVLFVASYPVLVRKQKSFNPLIPVFLFAVILTLFSFGKRVVHTLQFNTSPAFIDSAFTPFKPHVNTFWNANYFYVESKGIPTTHGMMVGISNHGWQQQVPIPQCYIGNNAWPIPLNPVMAANPIPVDSIHFTRGAIAIAANGVPIFNVHTNTGVDSYLDGQLDNYGGHCGRADDYHYHIAPLHLYNHTPSSLPCAFGLDGFPVYGSVEPDGTTVQPLDSNNGHYYGSIYHYHGVSSAPYMIARMAGVVTEDATHQLIPQAAANPVRPALTPLNGALITGCTPNQANNGYTLTYTLSGQTDSIVYWWNMSGLYTFNFYTAGNGTSTTQTYNDFIQCVVPTAVQEQAPLRGTFEVYPNPAKGAFQIALPAGTSPDRISKVMLYDLSGKPVYESNVFSNRIVTSSLLEGVYILQLRMGESGMSRKVFVNNQH